jgi:ABC-type iron transport system FetAB permease component
VVFLSFFLYFLTIDKGYMIDARVLLRLLFLFFVLFLLLIPANPCYLFLCLLFSLSLRTDSLIESKKLYNVIVGLFVAGFSLSALGYG